MIMSAAFSATIMVVALVLVPDERVTAVRFAGLLAGFGGVIVILAPWQPGAAEGTLAGKLAKSEIASARWIGKDAIRDLGRK